MSFSWSGLALFVVFCCAACVIPLHADSVKPLFSFGVFADAQYVDAPDGGNRCYRASVGKIEGCVNRFNADKPAFVFQLGDLIDRDGASFGPMIERYNKLSMPHYHVLGNHDFACGDLTSGAVVSRLGLKRRYYDFGKGSWRFIVLEPYTCVKAWFNGHDHKGNYGVQEGMHYATLHGMVDTPDTNAYALVEVYADRIVVVGSGRETSRSLGLR